jgi:hypothetical protein
MPFLWLILASSYRPLLVAQEPPVRAAVNFRVVDRYGHSLPYEIAELIDVQSKQNYSKTVNGTRARDLPLGKYTYRLQRTDHPYVAPLQGEITIADAEVWITKVSYNDVVVLDGKIAEPLMSSPVPMSFRGVVRWSRPSDRPVAVRIQPMFEGPAVETGMDTQGSFRMVGYFRGLYTISVLGDEGLLYAGGIVFQAMRRSPEPIVIDLSKRTPDTIIVE